MKNVKRLNYRRRFSEEFKKARVQEFESGEFSVRQLSRLYGIHFQSLYNWIYKYSTYNEKNVVVVESKHSSSEKLKLLESRIKELEQAVGRKQLRIDYLEKMIELASGELGMDIKKNSDTPHLSGSQKIEKK